MPCHTSETYVARKAHHHLSGKDSVLRCAVVCACVMDRQGTLLRSPRLEVLAGRLVIHDVGGAARIHAGGVRDLLS